MGRTITDVIIKIYSVALIATHFGITIYGTGAIKNTYGSVSDVTPQKDHHYLPYRNINGKTPLNTNLPNATLSIPNTKMYIFSQLIIHYINH